MRKILTLLFVAFGLVTSANAQKTKTIVIYDASGSMWGQIDGKPKYIIARDAFKTFIEQNGNKQDLGMIAYGHRERRECSDIEYVNQIGDSEPEDVIKSMRSIKPLGKTPLADSVRMAVNELALYNGPTNVILFTDGVESCGGDLCALADEIAKTHINMTANVIGLDLKDGEDKQIRCLANATGGVYVEASDISELEYAFEQVAEVIEVPVCDYTQVRTEMQKEVDAQKEYANDLKEQIASLRNDISNSNKNYQDASASAERIQSQLDIANSNNERAKNEISRLEGLLDKLNDEKSKLMGENTGLSTNLSTCERAKMRLETGLESTQNKLKHVEDTLRKTVTRLNDEIIRRQEAEKQNAIFETENKKLADSLQFAQDSLENVRMDLQNENANNANLQGVINGLEAKLSDTQTKLDIKSQEYDAAQNRANNLQSDIDAINNRVAKLQSEGDDLTSKLQALRSENLTLKQNLSDAEGEIIEQKRLKQLLVDKIRNNLNMIESALGAELGL